MANRKSNAANLFRTTLTSDMGPTDLECIVLSTVRAPASPCYLILDIENPSLTEIVFFDGTFTGTKLVTTSLTNRYLRGSAATSGLTHKAGASVQSGPVAQMLEDIHDRIDNASPKGTIVLYYGTLDGIPAGWQLCDGSNGTPDMRGMFPVGAGGAYTLGATGGAASRTLSVANLPSHSHSVVIGSNSHSHSGSTFSSSHDHEQFVTANPNTGGSGIRRDFFQDGSGLQRYSQGVRTGSHNHSHGLSIGSSSHSHSATVGTTGSGASFDNRPPFRALYFIMKVV